MIAYQIMGFIYSKGKAIAIEDLKKVDKGCRGDGKARLRKRSQHRNFRRLLQKIERTATLKGVDIIKVDPEQ